MPGKKYGTKTVIAIYCYGTPIVTAIANYSCCCWKNNATRSCVSVFFYCYSHALSSLVRSSDAAPMTNLIADDVNRYDCGVCTTWTGIENGT